MTGEDLALAKQTAEQWVADSKPDTFDRRLAMRPARAVAAFMATNLDEPLVQYQCAVDPEKCSETIAYVYHTPAGPVWLPVRKESGRAREYGFAFARILTDADSFPADPGVEGAVCNAHPMALVPLLPAVVDDYSAARKAGRLRVALVPDMTAAPDAASYQDPRRLRGLVSVEAERVVRCHVTNASMSSRPISVHRSECWLAARETRVASLERDLEAVEERLRDWTERLRIREGELQTREQRIQLASKLAVEPRAPGSKVGRNERCPCRSGLKYKHCHGLTDR